VVHPVVAIDLLILQLHQQKLLPQDLPHMRMQEDGVQENRLMMLQPQILAHHLVPVAVVVARCLSAGMQVQAVRIQVLLAS
jgi:hypothetical protein